MRWCGHMKKLKCLGMLEVENKITRTGGVRCVNEKSRMCEGDGWMCTVVDIYRAVRGKMVWACTDDGYK